MDSLHLLYFQLQHMVPIFIHKSLPDSCLVWVLLKCKGTVGHWVPLKCKVPQQDILGTTEMQGGSRTLVAEHTTGSLYFWDLLPPLVQQSSSALTSRACWESCLFSLGFFRRWVYQILISLRGLEVLPGN